MGTDDAPATACIVVPCFDEARRLDVDALLGLVTDGGIRLLLVDDGSTDGTRGVLDRLAAADPRIDVLGLPRNQGKAEAVRRGLVAALAGDATIVGYYDADLATPPAELLRLVDTLRDRPDTQCVLGARVALLGTTIERRAVRHYAGRLFASAASVALGVTVYDTQCGAKVFRRSDALVAATATPFRSHWAFDVELLARLLRGERWCTAHAGRRHPRGPAPGLAGRARVTPPRVRCGPRTVGARTHRCGAATVRAPRAVVATLSRAERQCETRVAVLAARANSVQFATASSSATTRRRAAMSRSLARRELTLGRAEMRIDELFGRGVGGDA